MTFRDATLCSVLAALVGACGSSETPCIEPAAGWCLPRAADEWAWTPVGAPVVLPERIEIIRGDRAARVIVLAGPPWPRRLTYRIGLTDGSMAIIGSEPIDPTWFAERQRALETDPGLDALMACRVLPDGSGELRLLPSRESARPPPPGEYHGTPYAGALLRRDAHGDPSLSYDLWVPDHTDRGIRCGDHLVLFQGSSQRFMQCRNRQLFQCPGCLGNTFDAQWTCSGAAPDGLLYCEPPAP